MPEIKRSRSRAVLADLHKPAPLDNRPPHYDLVLITRSAALRQARHLHRREHGAADRRLDARAAVLWVRRQLLD